MAYLLAVLLGALLIIAGSLASLIWLWKKGTSGKVVVVGLIAASVAAAYRVIVPSEAFYYAEFQRITGERLPKGAVFKFADASYPDIHGDYESCALVEVPQATYLALREKSTHPINASDYLLTECMQHLEDQFGKLSFVRESVTLDPHGTYRYWAVVAGRPEVIVSFASW